MSVLELLNQPLKAVNLGNKGFYDDLRGVGVQAINIDWMPVAKGDKALIAALDKREGRAEIDAANMEAIDRINASQPVLVGMGRALDLILTGRPVPAPEALAMGLVNRVTARGGALAEARELARQIAAFPQQCMLTDRRSAYAQWDLPLAEALHQEGAHGVPMVAADGE
jgi:enoyl-CoA hydratase/carnithine racemase